MSGRRGPVVLALPEDMLTDVVDCMDGRPVQPVEAYPAPAQMAQLKAMLQAAERPLMIVGGSGWSEDVRGQVQAWAEASEIPVGAVFRRQDYLDNDWPGYVGDVGIGIKIGRASCRERVGQYV